MRQHTALEYRRPDAAMSSAAGAFLRPRLTTATTHLCTIVHVSVILP